MDIILMCPACGAGSPLPVPQPASPVSCRSCPATLELRAAGAARPGEAIARCTVCGDDKLYIQKYFNQKLGCLIVIVGAALVPWTYGLSLGVFALIDYLLYRRLPFITVCYVCSARYRGFPINSAHHPFDLMTAQTWEARSLNWKRLNDRSGSDTGQAGHVDH